MGGGGGAPKPKISPQVSREVETDRSGKKKGKKRPVGAQYLQSRRATPKGAGFGGDSKTLG